MASKHAMKRQTKKRAQARRVKTEKQHQISLCMIVKNEEEFLPACLDSVKGVVDEIIIVDTGSTDRTVEIARQYGAKVYHYEWNDDFAAARNESLRHATCGWILVLDADERLGPGSASPLRAIASGAGPKAVYACRIENHCSPTRVTEHVASRFFPNHYGVVFEGPVHERPVLPQGGPLSPLSREYVPLVLEGFTVIHEGYREDTMRKRNKRQRNLVLLEKALSAADNEYYRYKLGATLLEEGRTQEAIGHLRAAVAALTRARERTTEYAAGIHALLLLSCAYMKNRELDLSKACADRALAAFPESVLAQYQMGLVMFERGELQEARDLFVRIASRADHGGFRPQDSLGFDPSINTWKSRTMAARCSLRMGDLTGAVAFLVDAARYLPRDAQYLTTVQRVLSDIEAGKPRLAGDCLAGLHFLRQVLEEEARDRKRAGDEEFNRGLYKSALNLYTGALALGYVPDGEILARVAACLVHTGRKHDGFLTYLKALRAAPGDVTTVNLLLELTRTFKGGLYPEPSAEETVGAVVGQ
ncbi:MAG: glycosyltransferase [Firmicutes bacterium]|nr:glycosyltransferase [Bacillota bacterium]